MSKASPRKVIHVRLELNPIKAIIRFVYAWVNWIERNTPGYCDRNETRTSVIIGLVISAGLFVFFFLVRWFTPEFQGPPWRHVFGIPLGFCAMWFGVTAIIVYVRKVIRTRKDWMR